ncbi:MAG: SUMF1/EgtB/PvdO family nonheme iron enzyme [Zetaproteobacteria bacterium]|nr:SUMF1/EgtB/PvdO family nonheme iron enzyme [Zetaproteobacteria bacterium]
MKRQEISAKDQARRKKLLVATLISCIAIAMIGGSLHVVKLGSLRLDEMRAKASYDLDDMHNRIRAAGEEIYLQEAHEKRSGTPTYSVAEAAALLPADRWLDLDTMIDIPASTFVMGSDVASTNVQNKPAHKVKLPAYKIAKYPVTQAQYARFVAAENYRPPLNWEDGKLPVAMEEHPVTMVSWYNARDYCAWVGQRLPSEAEWEHAARGDDERRWPWGSGMDSGRLNTYYQVRHTTPVTAYPNGASPYGVMDMAGNVQEWIADVFSAYPGSKAVDAVFTAKVVDENYKTVTEDVERVEFRVMRGGSWKSDPFSTTTYHRNYSLPNYASDFFGFRCASDAEVQAVGEQP